MSRPRKPYSIFQFSVLFAGCALLLFAAFGWFADNQLRSLGESVERSHQLQAQQELARAVDRVMDETDKLATAFADWQEVRQQLKTPLYFPSWRNHRMMNSGLLPDFVTGATVYGVNGEVLAGATLPPLPASLDPYHLEPRLVLGYDEPQLLFFQAVSDPASRQIQGYVGISAPFTSLLVRFNRFRFVDTDTLSVLPDPRRRFDREDMEEAFEYQLLANPESTAMEQLMSDTLYKMGLLLGLITLLFYPGLVYLVARPMRIISQHLDHLKHNTGGILLRQLKQTLPVAELETIRQSLNEYQCQLSEVHSRLDEKNRELWHLAHRDPLTGVANRRALEDFWESVCDLSPTLHFPLSFALFNVNHFKAINDTYGHRVGDKVLREISDIIVRQLYSHDRLYRLGGDEFAALLTHHSADKAMELAEACQTAVASHPFDQLGIKEPVRISIGLASQTQGDPPNLQLLQHQADIAMYSAKRPGKHHVAMFSPEMDADTRGLFSTWASNAVYEAISKGTGLSIHYQPIVDLLGNRIRYYESLVRIVSGNEMLLPSEIFPLVEDRKLESELDRAILRQVLADLDAGKIPKRTGVSVNISGSTIVMPEIGDWFLPFRQYMKDHYFVVEVTETALITQFGVAQENLSTLQALGFSVALDDFGSGYSSLRYLASMPVDIVKFDISMVHSLHEKEQRHIVLGLVKMMQEVGYAMVAEGIENAELLELARHAGFQYVQGYYLGGPGEVAENRLNFLAESPA